MLPGIAHFFAGRRRSGFVIAGAAGVGLVVAALVLLFTPRTEFLSMAVQPGWLVALGVGAILVALAWVVLVNGSYQVVKPLRVSRPVRAGVVLGLVVLSVAVAAPPLLVARYAYVQYSLLNDVFADSPDDGILAGGRGSGADPWGGRQRLNILMLASDAGPDRTGTRTDSLVVASIDVHSGDVVLISLPRNLQQAPMPAGPLREAWPDGFPDLLNAVYELVTEQPSLLAGARDRGAEAVKLVVGEILGLHIDNYVLADLEGFERFVDALGGVTLTVRDRLPIGGLTANGSFVPPVGYIEPGRQELDGYHALWYARSRRNSTDYDRMARQRCLIGALVRQADPVTVLRNFQSLASATKKLVSTDIPRKLLPNLVDLAGNVRENGQIRSLQIVPPLIKTYDPDFALIRSTVRRAISASTATADPSRSADPSRPGTPTPTASPTPTTGTGPGGSGRAGVDQTRRSPRASQNVDQACGFA